MEEFINSEQVPQANYPVYIYDSESCCIENGELTYDEYCKFELLFYTGMAGSITLEEVDYPEEEQYLADDRKPLVRYSEGAMFIATDSFNYCGLHHEQEFGGELEKVAEMKSLVAELGIAKALIVRSSKTIYTVINASQTATERKPRAGNFAPEKLLSNFSFRGTGTNCAYLIKYTSGSAVVHDTTKLTDTAVENWWNGFWRACESSFSLSDDGTEVRVIKAYDEQDFYFACEQYSFCTVIFKGEKAGQIAVPDRVLAWVTSVGINYAFICRTQPNVYVVVDNSTQYASKLEKLRMQLRHLI
ncbi:hypothetical protein [Pedobacter africanus]|uniref:hypothetical protein n=1 Tax=Pedobacter africanus TaxID=151894 RepID=UPI003394D30D